MKGLIITNPYDTGDVQLNKRTRMLCEFANLGVDMRVLSNDLFLTRIENGKIVSGVSDDFVLYFDKDKYVARMLEKCGFRVFNSASATEICDDKMLTHISLANCGVAMPKTLSGALCYKNDGEISKEYLNSVIDLLGLPLVVKECHGSFGEQVYLVRRADELFETVRKIKFKPYLFQQYIKKSSGKDMRVIVIGGKAVCAMLRRNSHDFRSNIQHGGLAEAAEIPDDIRLLCEKCARVIGLDYCGIDVLLGDEPLVCEVNSNAMFEAMERATGVNVAELYAKHIVKSVTENK